MQSRFAYVEISIDDCLDSCEQIIVDRIESHDKDAIDNSVTDMNFEIHFQKIIVLKNDLLDFKIESSVSSYVVQAELSRKFHVDFESVFDLKILMIDQWSNIILNLLSKLTHENVELCNRLHILTNLTMNFDSFAIVI